MTPTRGTLLCIVSLLAGVGMAASLQNPPEAFAKQSSESQVPQWEYTTDSVEPAVLEKTLNQLGGQGWEVFSIERDSLKFDQDQEKTTHLVTEKYRITARREKPSSR